METEQSIKILVIDDDESALDLIEFILSAAGYSIETASSLEEVRAQYDPAEFQLILCDIQLPDGSGMDYLKEVQKQQVPVPIIMITNYGSLQRVEHALKLGAYAFISKPVRKEHLLKVVKYVLEKGRMSWEQIVSEENIYSYFPPPA